MTRTGTDISKIVLSPGYRCVIDVFNTFRAAITSSTILDYSMRHLLTFTGLNRDHEGRELFCVEFACSPSVYAGSRQVLEIPPTLLRDA